MKNLIKSISIAALLFVAQSTIAQDFKSSIYSSSSEDMGVALTFLLKGTIGDIELGGYYETNSELAKKSENSKTEKQVNTFKGIYATIFLVGSEKINIGANMRLGLYNTEYVVATFAVTSEYYINNNVGIGLSALFVDELPKLEAKVTFNMAGSIKRLERQEKYKENKQFYKSMRKHSRFSRFSK